MTEPSEMISWLERRISSAMTWLDDHGKGSKKPRPDHEIETKEYDIARFEEIKGAYLKTLKKREQVVQCQ
ncbi:hypothetical protein HFO77_23310 [Rhizobium leguminosarum]|uniref:hypothetical protein n=1 Tax=Rhizobium leguminosarum TaxID=384 RepID=UPI001C989626|nr:hypothetical protein [Rhizobium leguminosarum]MBY5917326.1 hypothetical protein [Rhizobium leguminosarum]